MKKIGILGGLAWPSTAEYYAGICRLVEQRHANAKLAGNPVMPEMAIESLDVVRAASLFGDDHDDASWAAFDAYHRVGLQRLAQSGAEFAVIACNTAHHRFTQITRDITIPVLNIVEIAAAACARIGVERVLILGTQPVMQSAYFHTQFARHGIEAAGPRNTRDQRKIAATIRALQNERTEGGAKQIQAVVASNGSGRLCGSVMVYLGCTELTLAFPAHKRNAVFESDGVRYLNSTASHIHAAFEFATRIP